jgi:hypothetical protein
MPEPTRLPILILAHPPLFAEETSRVLAKTRFGAAPAQAVTSESVFPGPRTCLILSGTQPEATGAARFLAENSGSLDYPTVIVVGGDAAKFPPLPKLIWLAEPLTPEALEQALERASLPGIRAVGQVDRRASPRIRCRASMAPEVQLLDISEGGAQLEGPCPVPVGAVMLLELDGVLPQMNEPVTYQVLAVRPSPSGRRFRLHGRFRNLAASIKTSLRDGLQRLRSSGPPPMPWS